MKGKVSNIKDKLIPFASNIVLAAVNVYCLLVYYNNVAEKSLVNLGHVAYLTMAGNGLFGLTKIVSEESFIDLRILLDYGQVVLSHPFLTTALWQKLSVGPNEAALMHCFFGLVAFLFFAFMEYKRQDLTDLALITSITSSVIVGILYENYFACGAGILMAVAYFGTKRGTEECGVPTSQALAGSFNLGMAAYSVVALAQFEPSSWMPLELGAA